MKKDFLKYQAQTSPELMGLEIAYAKGNYIYDRYGKSYLDFIAGVSANSLGHQHPKVIEAIQKQLLLYTHIMVYGEFIQEMPLKLCKLLAENLPEKLNTTYLTTSGTEATEGALKLAKRVTGRFEIISAKNAYHGNTQGAMSVCGVEKQNRNFRPLIPGIKFMAFNKKEDVEKITKKTAGVILETIQGGAGFICPKNNYLQAVRKKCDEVGALLILDEIQTGVGRTGKLYAFEHYGITPDILITGKGLGGGMPIGAFISSYENMKCLQENPKLGHITTFGGHPINSASAYATLKEILSNDFQVLEKEKLFRELLQHPKILEIRGKGLMLALIFETPEMATKLILTALKKGLLLFWLLFENRAVRISPPLNISKKEIKKGCTMILQVISYL